VCGVVYVRRREDHTSGDTDDDPGVCNDESKPPPSRLGSLQASLLWAFYHVTVACMLLVAWSWLTPILISYGVAFIERLLEESSVQQPALDIGYSGVYIGAQT
jgi:hypothetical protein